MSAAASPAVVYVVDDDPDVVAALDRLLSSAGFAVRTFGSAEDFLAAAGDAGPGCLVLDLAMPDLGGLEVQALLEGRASLLPIVFLTGRGDVAASVRAMKHGAIDFLTKPVDDATLLDAVRTALARSVVLHRDGAARARTEQLLSTLTARERQVLDRVAAGRLNKQIAAELGATEKTIKFHRGNAMRKMQVRSVAELVSLLHRARPEHPT